MHASNAGYLVIFAFWVSTLKGLSGDLKKQVQMLFSALQFDCITLKQLGANSNKC